jgi:hypothetical protein
MIETPPVKCKGPGPLLTLAEQRAGVNESCGVCCAIANGLEARPERRLARACVGSAGMPVGIGEVDTAEPLAAFGAVALGRRIAGMIAVGDPFA